MANYKPKETLEFTKTQKKILGRIKMLGPGLASTGMLSHDLGLQFETVKCHLKKLTEMGAVSSTDCSFHENTKVFELTDDGLFWFEPVKL